MSTNTHRERSPYYGKQYERLKEIEQREKEYKKKHEIRAHKIKKTIRIGPKRVVRKIHHIKKKIKEDERHAE
jgi:hypothetical protein